MTAEDHRRNPVDAALDLMVFAPIGLLANCRQLVPTLAAKGREVVDQRVTVARFVGRFVLGQARSTVAAAPPAPSPATSGVPDGDQHIAVRVEDADGRVSEHDGTVDADELAIPQYDSLAASQVVARLEGLTATELDAVGRYELAHRGRKTVLGKIDQLRRH
jgi:hypothetical protein